MVSPQNEFLLNQHTESASLDLPGQFLNVDFPPRPQSTAEDLTWCTANIDDIVFNNDFDVSQSYHDSQFQLPCVSSETYEAGEAVSSSAGASFRTICQPSDQFEGVFDHVAFNLFDMAFASHTPLFCADGNDGEVFEGSTESTQAHWSPTVSYPSPDLDFDVNSQNDEDSILRSAESNRQTSKKGSKCQIAKITSLKCPYCDKTANTRSHISRCKKIHEQPITCDACGKQFIRLQDATRHSESSCMNRSKSIRPWRCKCGKDYTRRDHVHRHIKVQGASDCSKTLHTLLVQVDLRTDQ